MPSRMARDIGFKEGEIRQHLVPASCVGQKCLRVYMVIFAPRDSASLRAIEILRLVSERRHRRF